jgi:hypothetical protein
VYLRGFDNVEANPKIQLFTQDDLEEEEQEERKYYCVCKSRLEYHKHLGIWICSECYEQYDTNIQDAPLKDISGPRVKTYPELKFNPTYDELDVHMPFVEAINFKETGEVELVRSSSDRRIQHIIG